MKCELCPRMCGVDRSVRAGACGATDDMLVARAAPHLWEEPCISGARGSGAVFFGGCALKCAYCQNYELSHAAKGEVVTPQQLADIFRRLEDAGVHNVNLVTGTQFTPGILRALDIYRPKIPIVWNSGGYERVETLKMLEGEVDVYLPDCKHVSPRLSKLCAGAEDYFERASRAVIEMCRQTGLPQYDENGLMTRGTLVRHLVLPGCTADSMRVLDFIAQALPKGTPVSLMRQYTPVPQCNIKGLNRRITNEEYARVLFHLRALGLSGYCQQKDAADAQYTPAFDGFGVHADA